jgi:phospholipid/cholesterol/gamma-HCH transport system substrate-binding protein
MIWLAGAHELGDRARYTVYFTDPLSGLEEEAVVKYKGVEVGRIVDMRLTPERSDLVKVDIEVLETTPVRAGTEANIAIQGVTGFAYLDLSTASTDKEPPARPAGERYPVLKGTGSQFAKFIDQMPAVSSQFKSTLSAVDELSREGAKTADSIRELADTLKEDPSKIISPPSYEGVKIPK